MAFGGVAMGNIKAQLLAMVTGMSKYKSGISKPIAIPATTGAKTATRATLLINSVIKSIKRIKRETVSNTFKLALAIPSVIKETIPVVDMPLAKAKPPPKRIKIPQAKREVSSHFRIKIPCLN